MKTFILKTKKGGIQILPIAIIAILLIGLFSLGLYENVIAVNKCTTFQNALDSTNLALARNVNQRHLARTGELTFKEEDIPGAFETYKQFLKANFQLDSTFHSKNQTRIIGGVEILDLRLYSVEQGGVVEWRYSPYTHQFIKGYSSHIPGGKPVQFTSVYSKIKLKTSLVMKSDKKQCKDLIIKSYVDFIKEDKGL